MRLNFSENRPLIEQEYEHPRWLTQSGLPAEELSRELRRFVDEHQTEPMPLLRAKAFGFLLDHAQIAINPSTPFADKINLGIDYSNYAGQDLFAKQLYHRFHREVLEREIPDAFRKRNLAEELGVCFADADFWHTLPDWGNLLNYGFSGLKERAERYKSEKAAAGVLTARQAIFYDSVIISFTAILRYIGRLRDASRAFDIPEYTACLDALLVRAPGNLYEVMEATLLYLNMEETGVERARTLGRIDQSYLPYFRGDLQNGTYSEEEIRELFRYFFIKFQAAKRFADQPFTICGVKEDGTDASNELTRLILDVYGELGVCNPKIHVCCRDDTPEDLLQKCAKLIQRGNNSFCFINDEMVYKGYEKIGIPREISRNYIPFGCYEPGLPGLEEPMIGASWLNIPKAVEFALNGGRDVTTGEQFCRAVPASFKTYEDFYRAFLEKLREIVEFTIDNILLQDRYHMQINPSPVYSATEDSCMERGRDVFDGGMRYHNTSIKCCGIATAVDSLLAVKRFVYEKGAATLEEMKRAIAADWKGYEALRLRIRNDPVKYGNHLPEPDALAHDIYKFLAGLIVGRPNQTGGVFRLGCDTITNHVTFGKRMGATPDGRRAGEAVSKNFNAVNGMDRNGITAYLESVCAMDMSDFLNGAVTDFILHPSAVEGEKGVETIVQLIKTYFRMGGYAIQGNIVDLETLLAARRNPEKYRTLQVRVCGWNEYFVEMDPDVQMEFIRQLRGA